MLDMAVRIISGFRRSVNRSSLLWDVTQHRAVVTDVSEQPISPILKRQAVQKMSLRFRPTFISNFAKIGQMFQKWKLSISNAPLFPFLGAEVG
jgi:hypothetical protein